MAATAPPDTSNAPADAFIARWRGMAASELSTSQSFLIELCQLLGVDTPHAKLARKLGIKTAELNDQLTAAGYLEARAGRMYLTEKGKAAGGEFRMSPRFGAYFLWPAAFKP